MSTKHGPRPNGPVVAEAVVVAIAEIVAAAAVAVVAGVETAISQHSSLHNSVDRTPHAARLGWRSSWSAA